MKAPLNGQITITFNTQSLRDAFQLKKFIQSMDHVQEITAHFVNDQINGEALFEFENGTKMAARLDGLGGLEGTAKFYSSHDQLMKVKHSQVRFFNDSTVYKS